MQITTDIEAASCSVYALTRESGSYPKTSKNISREKGQLIALRWSPTVFFIKRNE